MATNLNFLAINRKASNVGGFSRKMESLQRRFPVADYSIKYGEIWKHSNGQLYRIIPCPKSGDTGVDISQRTDIWYQNIETYQVYTKTLEDFLGFSVIDGGTKVARFTLQALK